MIKIREEKVVKGLFDDSVIDLFAEMIVELHKKRKDNGKRNKDNRGRFESRH